MSSRPLFGLVALGFVSVASGDAVRADKMYWTDAGAGTIHRADLDGSSIEDLVTTGLMQPVSVALDLLGNKMYWADWGAGKIQRANLDGSGVEDLVTDLSSPYGVALDLSERKMYWTNAGAHDVTDGTIHRAGLDGLNVEDLVTTDLYTPNGIAVDPGTLKMYWADRDAHKIQRAHTTGFFVEDVYVGPSGMFAPRQVALDVEAGKVYWTVFVFEDGWIVRANLDGSGVETLVTTGTGLGGPATEGLALDQGAGKMYWTQWNGQIWRANLDGSSCETVLDGLFSPRGIALDLREPIPTVSEWGLLSLTLLLLVGGTVLVRRKLQVA